MKSWAEDILPRGHTHFVEGLAEVMVLLEGGWTGWLTASLMKQEFVVPSKYLFCPRLHLVPWCQNRGYVMSDPQWRDF